MHRVVFVEGADVRVHRVVVLPRRRHQEAQTAEQVRAAHHQRLEHVVERHRIGAGGRNDRPDVGHVWNQLGLELDLTGARPVAVAGDRVDLAVVGEHAERLRQTPLRPGVGREALVKNDQAAGKTRIVEIAVKDRQILREHQTLVADDAARQGRLEVHRVNREQRLLGTTTGDVQRALEVHLVEAGRRVDEDLLEVRQALQRVFAAYRRIDRQHTEAGDLTALRGQLSANGGAGVLCFCGVARQEHQTRGVERRERDAGFGSHGAQKGIRLLEQQAATIARQPIGSHRTAVSHTGQRGDCRLHQMVCRLVVDLGDQPKTAAVLLEIRAVEGVT